MSSLPSPDSYGPKFSFSSLTQADRLALVALSADFNTPGAAYAPFARFDLTALGADVDLDGHWNSQVESIVEWRHLATTGRDQVVRIVQKGYLFPLGHRAVIITLIERVLTADPAGSWSDAILQSQTFIKVIEEEKSYPCDGQLFSNDWPFTSVKMKTLTTPPLNPTPTFVDAAGQLIEITDGSGNPIEWSFYLTDEAGRTSLVTGPLCFMYGQGGGYKNEYDSTVTTPLAADYNALPVGTANRLVRANGELIKYAPEGTGKAGATTHPTIALTLGVATPLRDPVAGVTMPAGSGPTPSALYTAAQPAFYPTLTAAQVRLPAAEALSRGPLNDSNPLGGVSIQYYPDFVVDGLVNAGSVYMALSDAVNNVPGGPPALKFPGDAVGGIGTPNIQVTGLSSVAGLVSGTLDDYAAHGKQDPSSYFPGLTGPNAPQLLGGLHLGQILGEFLNEFSLPTIVNSIELASGARQITYEMTAALQYYPDDQPPGYGDAIFRPDSSDGTMTLTATVTINPANGQSSYVVNGEITPFTVNIIGTTGALSFIQIPFERVKFTSQSGKKPDIKVEIGQVTFQGALSFVNALEQFLEDLGGSGFTVSIRPTGINAGFSISLPDLSLGMVDLSGLALSAAVDVPFLGAPATATFSFASKEHPFTVSVSMFGGSGYITLVLGLQQVQQVTASVQFGGNFELDIYVASGGISVTAGIFYQYTAANGLQLTGFVKMQGSLEVLGIVSISCELDLSLTYQVDNAGNSYVSGQAQLTASIHILFFTISIGVTIHKQFSGSGSAPPAQDPGIVRPRNAHALPPEPAPVASASGSYTDPVTPPTFASFITSADEWASYCAAFAA